MTVSSSVNKVSYAGNGSTTVFSVGFYFFVDSDLLVVLRDSDGIETIKTLTTDYTVTGAGNPAGGSITMNVAPASGETLVIAREVPLTQQTDYLANDPFPAETHERALDKLTMAVQQIQEQVDRSAKLPISDPASADSLVADLVRIADSIDNVDTVANDIANVNTVAGIDSEITTVAGISGNVTTVAGIAANVTTVAGISANVTTVAGINADVSTVAGIAANVTTVADNDANITVVATDLDGDNNIGAVAAVATEVAALGPISADVITVAGIASDVTAVAGDATDIGTVAANITNVNTVAGISANVTTVAGISADVTAVAGDATDIGTVAASIASVNTVAGISADVTTVAGLDTEITALGARTTEIDALYAEIDDIGTKVSKTSDTGSAILPAGTEAQRDVSPVGGYLRFNTDADEFEGYNGTEWGAIGGGAEITNDTSTSTDVYPVFVNATTGKAEDIYTSNDKLLYKPSTGELKSEVLVAQNGIVVNSATVTASYTIPSGSNASSAGPVVVDTGVSVTISSGSRWVVN